VGGPRPFAERLGCDAEHAAPAGSPGGEVAAEAGSADGGRVDAYDAGGGLSRERPPPVPRRNEHIAHYARDFTLLTRQTNWGIWFGRAAAVASRLPTATPGAGFREGRQDRPRSRRRRGAGQRGRRDRPRGQSPASGDSGRGAPLFQHGVRNRPGAGAAREGGSVTAVEARRRLSLLTRYETIESGSPLRREPSDQTRCCSA